MKLNVTPPTLQNYQFYYRGVTMGIGTNYDIIRVDGLEDLNVRVGDRDFPRSHGQIPGRHLASYRVVTVDLEVNGIPGSTSHNTDLQRLLSALSPDQGAGDGTVEDDERDRLYWKFPGETTKFVRCRPVKRRLPRRADTEYGYFPVNFQLRASDPRKYGAVLNSSGSHPYYTDVVNAGDARAYPTILLTKTGGSGTILKLDNKGDGGNSSPTLFSIFLDNIAAGGYLCDMDSYIRGTDKQTITLVALSGFHPLFPLQVINPGINKYGTWRLPRKPFYLLPGSNRLTGYASTDLTQQSFNVYWYDTLSLIHI